MDGIERIKQLAADIKDKPLLKIVEYLLNRTDMDNKYLNEEKTLKQMIEFIRGEAQKQAEDNVAIIEDEEVYSWAIHYWDESNKNLKINEIKRETTKKVEQVKKEPKKVVSEGQLTLFDLM